MGNARTASKRTFLARVNNQPMYLRRCLGLFRLAMKIFLGVTSNVSEGCREGFLGTN